MAVARDLLGTARRSVQRTREVVCDTRGMSAPMPDVALDVVRSGRLAVVTLATSTGGGMRP